MSREGWRVSGKGEDEVLVAVWFQMANEDGRSVGGEVSAFVL